MIYGEEDKSKYKIEYNGEKFSRDLFSYKVIVIGRYGVGKTTITKKLIISKDNDKEYTPTISIDIKNLQIKVNEKILQISFWDCCSDYKFAINSPNLFKNVSIALFIYDINNKNSFKALEIWYNILKNHSSDNIIFLIGNNNDLEKEREVTIEEAEAFKNNYYDIKMFFETSALKNDNNLDKLLENIAITIYEKDKEFENEKDNPITKAISLFKWTLQ